MRRQPGINDLRNTSGSGPSFNYGNWAGQNVNNSQRKAPSDSFGLGDVGDFVANEMLGADDFAWAKKNAEQGNWWEAVKSAGAGVLELGGTVADAAAIVGTFGMATPAVAARQAGRQAAKQAAKTVAEQFVEKRAAKKVVKEAERVFRGESKVVRAEAKELADLDRRTKHPSDLADELLRDLNPFSGASGKGNKVGSGKGNTGGVNPTNTKSKQPGSGGGELGGPNSGGTRSGQSGGGGGGELAPAERVPAEVGARGGSARPEGERISPPRTPKEPPKKPLPGGSSAVKAEQEEVKMLESMFDAPAAKVEPKLEIPKTNTSANRVPGILGLAGATGLGLTASMNTNLGAETATETALSTNTTMGTTTKTGAPAGGGGGGGGGGGTSSTASPAEDVHIPYIY